MIQIQLIFNIFTSVAKQHKPTDLPDQNQKNTNTIRLNCMTILLFGATKDIVGTPSLSVPTASLSGKKIPNTVGELKKFLESRYPELKKIARVTVAVNQNFAKDHERINSYDEIALIPSPEE